MLVGVATLFTAKECFLTFTTPEHLLSRSLEKTILFDPNIALNKKEECNCYSSVKAKGIPFGLRSCDQREGKKGYSRYLFLIPVTVKHAQEQCQTCHCQNAVHIFVWQLHTLYVTVFL